MREPVPPTSPAPSPSGAPGGSLNPRRLIRAGVVGWSVTGLFILAVVYTLWAAQTLLMPIVLAIFLAIVLAAPVRLLALLRVPDAVGAGLIVVAFLGTLAAAVYFLSEPALTWVDRAPQVVRQIEYRLAPITRQLGGATEATREIEQITESDSDDRQTIRVTEGTLAATVLNRAGTIAAGAVITTILMFFLLALGRRTSLHIVRALEPGPRRVYADIMTTVQREIAVYLQTITLINILLGAATSGVMWATGMPSPVLWGVMAGVLNFMPYIGPMVTVSIISVVSLLSFETPGAIALPPLAFVALTSLEGYILTPMVVGRRLTLNPLVVFVSVVAWGWLWGVAGALLAVPLLAVLKIILDRTGGLPVLRAALE